MTMRLASTLAVGMLFWCGCGSDQSPPPKVVSAPRLTAGHPAPRPVHPPPPSIVGLAKGAMLFEGLGTYSMPLMATPEAKAYFDQGLRLTYGFNHDEAARSFAHAAELDPTCAMCFWGVALTLGPNYNVPMLPDRAATAWDALQRAKLLAPSAAPVDQALIAALAARYKGPEPLSPAEMQPFNVAYANAMRGVARQFPNDQDVQTLFAESTMDVHPWKLWTLDGKPTEGTEETVRTLESVLLASSTHPGANHYYIHAVEASSHPEKALPSAERLPSLMPGAGHIVHMPAHIFQRVGRYADASAANAKAAEVDKAYLAKTTPPGYYPMYLGHNYGFLSFSASMEGRQATSLSAARDAMKALPPAMIDMMPGMDFFIAEPLLAMVRFGRWDDLLAEPQPDPKYPVLSAFWHHGHGMALAAKGRIPEAKAEVEAIAKITAAAPPDLQAGQSVAKDVFALAGKILEARIATLQKSKNALALWAQAVEMGDHLAYSEPDDWFYPVRHYHGAALLNAGKAAEAQAVYLEDLRRHPHNGWALFGVWKSLAAQKKPEADVAAAKAEFDAAWAHADIPLTSTAF
jgi:tetratricopeptide (TPR) repeat protein